MGDQVRVGTTDAGILNLLSGTHKCKIPAKNQAKMDIQTGGQGGGRTTTSCSYTIAAPEPSKDSVCRAGWNMHDISGVVVFRQGWLQGTSRWNMRVLGEVSEFFPCRDCVSGAKYADLHVVQGKF